MFVADNNKNVATRVLYPEVSFEILLSTIAKEDGKPEYVVLSCIQTKGESEVPRPSAFHVVVAVAVPDL